MLWLDKLLHPTVIAIRKGQPSLVKGQLPSSTIREIGHVLTDYGINKGSITIDGMNRVHFSLSFPSPAHQRLRNVVFSG